MSTKALPMKSRKVTIKFAPDQFRKIEERAEQRGLKMSVWMRLILMQATSRPSSDGYIRIKEPDGVAL